MNADQIRNKRIWNKFCNNIPISEIAYIVGKSETFVYKVITNMIEFEQQKLKVHDTPANPMLDKMFSSKHKNPPFILITNNPEVRKLAKKLNLL